MSDQKARDEKGRFVKEDAGPTTQKYFNRVAALPIPSRKKSLYQEAVKLESPDGMAYAHKMMGNKNFGKDVNLPLSKGQKKDPRLVALEKALNGEKK